MDELIKLLLAASPLTLGLLAILGFIYRDIRSSGNERKRIEIQEKMATNVNTLATALNTRAEIQDATLRANTHEVANLAGSFAELGTDVRDVSQSNRDMTASVVGMTKVTAEGNALVRSLMASITEQFTKLIGAMETANMMQNDRAQANTNAVLDLGTAVSSLQRNIEMTSEDTRHILAQMNPKILKSFWIDYDVVNFAGATPDLVVRNYDPDLVDILGQTPQEMLMFTPNKLAGQWYDLKGSPIPPAKMPTHRALQGEENAQHLIFKNLRSDKSYDLYVTASPRKVDNLVRGVHVTYSQVADQMRESFRLDKLNHYPKHAHEPKDIAATPQQLMPSPSF